jgi:hypothetical protein
MRRLLLALLTALCSSAAISQTIKDQLPDISGPDTTTAFNHFTVSERNGSAILKWASSSVHPDDYFIVEKSTDGIHFETMSAIGSTPSGADSSFSITDNAVGKGMVYYRIRISGEDGRVLYSKTLGASLSVAVDFRFYPNPVDKLLIIRSPHSLAIQVIDGYGIVWFSQDVDAGMQIINVSTLPKGSYILKATDKETSTVISEQLVKS